MLGIWGELFISTKTEIQLDR